MENKIGLDCLCSTFYTKALHNVPLIHPHTHQREQNIMQGVRLAIGSNKGSMSYSRRFDNFAICTLQLMDDLLYLLKRQFHKLLFMLSQTFLHLQLINNQRTLWSLFIYFNTGGYLSIST